MNSQFRNQSQKGIMLFIILGIILFNGCRPETEPLEKDLVLEQLKGTWRAPSTGAIVIDGVDYTQNFIGFKITITEEGYSTINGGELFNATGTWEFVSSDGKRVLLDDNKVLRIVELTETTVNFTFQNNVVRGQANLIESITGSYAVNLNKE